MQHEHAHRDEVGVTQVVNESADVAIVTGINTIHLSILNRGERKKKKNSVQNSAVHHTETSSFSNSYTAVITKLPYCPGRTSRNRLL